METSGYVTTLEVKKEKRKKKLKEKKKKRRGGEIKTMQGKREEGQQDSTASGGARARDKELEKVEFERLKALGSDKFKEKKYAEAITYYDQACAVIYSNSSKRPINAAAEAEAADDDPFGAGTRLSSYVVCKNNAAQCCINFHNFKGGVKFTSEALLKDPNNFKALYRRGISYMGLEEWGKAFDDLKAHEK